MRIFESPGSSSLPLFLAFASVFKRKHLRLPFLIHHAMMAVVMGLSKPVSSITTYSKSEKGIKSPTSTRVMLLTMGEYLGWRHVTTKTCFYHALDGVSLFGYYGQATFFKSTFNVVSWIIKAWTWRSVMSAMDATRRRTQMSINC